MRPIRFVVDLAEVARQRRLLTERATRFEARTRKKFEDGEVKVVHGNGLYDVLVGDRDFHYTQVGVTDPTAKFRVGDQVLLGFLEDNPYLPFIVSRGRSIAQGMATRNTRPAPPAPRRLGIWSQSEATHLRNNCAGEAARAPSFGAGVPIYTYFSRAVSAHDSRSRAFGLVSFREGVADESRLGIAYPRFNSAGDALEAYVIKVLDIDGAPIRSTEFATTSLAPIGNPSATQLFLDPDRLHFWLTPQFSVDQVRMRSWYDGAAHQLDSASDRGNDFVSVAYNAVLYPAFIASYSGGENAPGSPPAYWPPTISPLSKSLSGSFQGLMRDQVEVITSWSIDPSVICNLPNSIMSDCSGNGTGWPAAPDGLSWTVAVSERSMMDGTDPANAALGHGYRQADHYTGGTIQHLTNLLAFSHKLQLNIAELDVATGHRLWVRRFTVQPQAPIVAEGLLTPFEAYLASPFGSGPGDIGHGPVIVEGRVAENSLSDKTPTDGFGYAYPVVYPGRLIESGVTIQGVAFSWPSFQYFRASNIRLFPHRSNNVLAIPPSTDSSSFYSGCKNSLPAVTDFGLTESGQSSPCGPGIFRDTRGNIYFSYMFPRGFQLQGNIYFRAEIIDSAIQDYVRHRPVLTWGWESRQVSLDKTGAIRWERDLTQWRSDAEWWGRTGSDFGFDFVVGGAAGEPLPMSDDVPWQVPVGDGKFLLTLRELHGLGSGLRPDMYLEVLDGATGTVLQSQFLPDYFDVYSADVRRNTETGAIDPGGTLIAYAGERVWFVSSTRVKAAVDVSGIPWAIVYMRHDTRDPYDGIDGYEQIYVIQAPSDGSLGPWSGIGLETPSGTGEDFPSGADWESVIISDGFMVWNHWDGSSWKIYKKPL